MLNCLSRGGAQEARDKWCSLLFVLGDLLLWRQKVTCHWVQMNCSAIHQFSLYRRNLSSRATMGLTGQFLKAFGQQKSIVASRITWSFHVICWPERKKTTSVDFMLWLKQKRTAAVTSQQRLGLKNEKQPANGQPSQSDIRANEGVHQYPPGWINQQFPLN